MRIDRMISEPEKGPEKLFDPERDISEEQWHYIVADSQRFLREKDYASFCDIARLQVLANRPPKVTDGQWEELSQYRSNKFTHAMSNDFSTALTLELLVGKKTENNYPLLKSIKEKQGNLDWIVKSLDWASGRKEWNRFANIAALEMLLGYDPEITEEQWQEVTKMREAQKPEQAAIFSSLATLETLRNVKEIKHLPDGKIELIYQDADSDADTAAPPKPRKF